MEISKKNKKLIFPILQKVTYIYKPNIGLIGGSLNTYILDGEFPQKGLIEWLTSTIENKIDAHELDFTDKQ